MSSIEDKVLINWVPEDVFAFAFDPANAKHLQEDVVLAALEVSLEQIKDPGPDFGIYVLAFRDPDNIQLELTAPYE